MLKLKINKNYHFTKHCPSDQVVVFTIQKSEVIKQIAQSTNSSIKTTEETVNELLSVITKNLKDNDKIQFTGFGSFNAKNVPARKGRNPATGDEITISARRQVTFSVGKELKESVNS